MAKSVTIECPECGTKFTIVTKEPESIQYCPFCGESCLLPYDDADGAPDTDDEEVDDDE